MRYQTFPPLPQLQHLLMHVLVCELDGCDAYIPATPSPSIMLTLRGTALVRMPDHSYQPSPRFLLLGPFMTPLHTRYAPGTVTISMCFRPGMLPQACSLSPVRLAGNSVEMEAAFDAGRVQRFLARIDEQNQIAVQAALFQELLLEILDYKNGKGLGERFLRSHQKMFLPLLELASFFDIGQRQLERRVQDTFGLNLRDMRKLSRYGFCLLHLLSHPTQRGDLTQIAQQFGYYDQAHMHKEFVELTGFSPAHLLRQIASNDAAFWLYRIAAEDFRNLFYAV
ncbi:AraC family transcriptional regulator [Undibacterium rugosum]|uniref:AraC family transcriptional regulator n=1 Tax=Undibacterium rugosum TaxID=2762291 RepID=A0A923KW03_9BURK|nr:helix-turn-helix domain-containing protein [Undibacterium rugosum]MBC3935977.1 AraC family transcriptional regulator [Undibacterium rugosum]MBR7778690.1 AraC family transcriptional regulator [Undibacterium rugosum]